MRNAIILGTIVSAVIMASVAQCGAAGAVAIGLPSDVAKQGVSMGDSANDDTMDKAKSEAIAACKNVGSDISKALCKVVATFRNQCAAIAEDPKDGTPGFGWAVADTLQEARGQALENCRDSAGPSRRDACEVSKGVCDGSAKPSQPN